MYGGRSGTIFMHRRAILVCFKNTAFFHISVTAGDWITEASCPEPPRIDSFISMLC